MSEYAIAEGPSFVADGDEARLSGHYEVRLTTGGAAAVTRYLTDKGRAEVLRIMESRRSLTASEFEEHTVEADLGVLLARMDREGGEGA
jgi:hypothetical protein